MRREFNYDFNSCDERGRACGWTVLSNSDLPGEHRAWKPHNYIITAPGNRHLPNLPELGGFSLETVFAVNDRIARHPELRIFFFYDAFLRCGSFVSCRIEDGRIVASSGTESGHVLTTVAEKSAPFDTGGHSPWRIVLEVKNGLARLRAENGPEFIFPVPQKTGRIAIDRGDFPGPMELRELKIVTDDPIAEREILEPAEIVFPPGINGFHTPLRYKTRIVQFGKTARLDLEISGSDVENPDVPWFPYHGLMIDLLTAPYVRLGKSRLYPGGQETLVLAKPNPERQNYFYDALHRKPEWPLRATFFLSETPDISTIGFGYEHCEIRTHAKHLRGGPNEIIYDFKSGKTLYAGHAPRPDTVWLELHSQPDKRLLKEIPKTDPRHEAALAFVRRNHFFMESEPCRFTARLRFGGHSFSAADFSLTCVLENAVTETIEALQPEPFKTAPNARLDFTELSAGLPRRVLPPGVYHLKLEMAMAGAIAITQRHAFEVIPADPDAPAPPLISGLPFLFTMPTEVKGLEQDQFEPYLDAENPVAHYLSATTHYPEVGRRHKIYDTLKIYRRKWFLWLTDRVSEHPDLEQNKDLVGKCDFLYPPDPVKNSYAPEMWKPASFQGAILGMLTEFLRDNLLPEQAGDVLTVKLLEELAAEPAPFPEKAIDELVTRYWRKWLVYFNARLHGEETALREKLKTLNPNLKRAAYGPMNCYASRGKMSYVRKYRGADMKVYDGFYVFEDYPFSCKYNIHHGPLMLASFKMAEPAINIYPEIYAPSINGCPDGAVAYAWPPFGCTMHAPESERKRIFEYAFAAAWFDNGKFNYWKDYGFHARGLSRERFAVLLDAWKFIRNAPPAKPLRGTAYVYSDILCENHPSFYEYSQPGGHPWGDIFNTAEETIPFAWEIAREDGQQSGFLCSLESLHQLAPEDAGLLVLPPLRGVNRDRIDAIRELHRHGVNLLAFETVDGLEDLFGVEPLDEPAPVYTMRVNADLADNPLSSLTGLKEQTAHPLCKAHYRAAKASVLLAGEAPVLLTNRTACGRTALFNIPPTVVRRDSFYERAGYGRASISELINQSAALIQRELGSPAVTTSAGKIVAFEDINGNTRVIAEEDAFPNEGGPIAPLVTIHLPDIEPGKLVCDKPFKLLRATQGSVSLRLRLKEHECAIITINH